MILLFIYEEGVLMGIETLNPQDAMAARTYFERQGYLIEEEKVAA